MLTKNQLIISCIFNGGNALFLIYYIYDIIARPTDFEHITRWSYYLNSIFTTICLYCDIMEYFTQENNGNIESLMQYNLLIDDKNNEQKIKIIELNDWNRNKFGVICNSLCYFVSIGFWSLFLLGNNLMLISKSIKSLFNCIYHHCIIQIIVIIDIFAFKREIHKFNWNYFGIIYSIFISYSIIIYLEKYVFGRNAYFFMDGSSKLFLFLCLIISSILLFFSYLIHIHLIEFKYKVIKKEELLIDDNNYEKEIEDRL
jgi:hypothetical protein